MRAYLDQWLNAKAEVSASTKVAYDSSVREFCDFLPDRADLQPKPMLRLFVIQSQLVVLRPQSTARLKILRVAFQQAWRDGVIEDNPAAKVPLLKQFPVVMARRAFTVAELKSLLAAAADEWKGVILVGIYTGQRLGDVVRLRWDNVDLATDTLAFTTQKTHRRQILPIAAPPGNGSVVNAILASRRTPPSSLRCSLQSKSPVA